MRCRRRNEEELFGGGGQSLTVLLRNHHIKAHRVLTWRESPVSLQSNAGPATAILLQHDHHATTHGSPNPKSSVAEHQEAHQDVLGRVRLHCRRHLCKRGLSRNTLGVAALRKVPSCPSLVAARLELERIHARDASKFRACIHTSIELL